MSLRPGYKQAEACWLPKPQIHHIAESIASQLGYKPGDDLHELVSKVGGRVKVETTLLQDPTHSGSLYVDSLNDFEILVPSHTSLARDRFTVAHELGHYYLHYVLPREAGTLEDVKVVALRKGSTRIEWEANWFAAAFLMPAQIFSKSYREAGSLNMVAHEFDVSLRAAEVRAADLHL
nr:ImmA/IrrE family metallo-endopeptidase [uncultured Brevundimonas sp.]